MVLNVVWQCFCAGLDVAGAAMELQNEPGHGTPKLLLVLPVHSLCLLCESQSLLLQEVLSL